MPVVGLKPILRDIERVIGWGEYGLFAGSNNIDHKAFSDNLDEYNKPD